jgi:hypothetical protein
MLALALFGLVQAGCQSAGCNGCNIGSKISNGVQALTARVTKHFDGCHGGADCGCGGETIVDSGPQVISGGMVIPAPGTMVPAPMEQPPTQLDPIPTNGQPTSGSTRSTPSGASRSSYTTMNPSKGTTARRPTDVSRALHSSPDGSSTSDTLDNLPPVPVDLPSNATSAAKPLQLPSETQATTPGASTKPGPVAPASPTANPPASNSNPTTPTPAEKVSAAEGAIGSVPPIETPMSNQAPGIRCYASIAPALSGGSTPSIEGLDWLNERGCRTFIDLRKPSEVDANFVEAVNDRNMVYISLPIVATRLDASRLARFDDLVSPTDHRRLYFCDTDGTRAGLAWYIHLRSVDQEESQSAKTKAEEIGLTDAEVKLAEAYLVINKPRPKVSTNAKVALATPSDRQDYQIEPTPAEAPASVAQAPAVVAPRPALPGGSPPSPSNPDAVPGPSTDPTPSMLPGEDRPQASSKAASGSERLRDPAFWRPVAAMVMAGIGVPLAYWSRSAFNGSRPRRARASLPGAVLPPSDARVSLDA